MPTNQTLIIQDPDARVQISNKRRAKYWHIDQWERIPKKYFKNGDRKGSLLDPYEWKQWSDGNTYIWDTKNKTRVVSNPRSAGTPKIITVNGQDLYNGNMHPHTRKVVAQHMHEYLGKYIVKNLTPVQEFPIIVGWEYYEYMQDKRDFDLDNLWFWKKFFIDSLVIHNIIPDDSVQYISGIGGPLLYPVDRIEDRRFVWHLMKDDRLEIQGNPKWQ